ncbi:MAG: cytochrome C [Dehalococcoidia bacterium]|nr:cytochrome C [Dehalococcoidia bacterium]
MDQVGSPSEKPGRWKPSFKFKKPNFKLSGNMALITGVTMGLLAAVVQGYFGLQPPAGDGICAVSHPVNLINWFLNNIFNTDYTLHSIFVEVPVLTSVGFIIGSVIASVRNKEFKFRRGPVRDNVLAFILGFVIINVGLLWGSCPIRTAVLSAYGMYFAMLMMGMMILGVVAACLYIKWKVRRTR